MSDTDYTPNTTVSPTVTESDEAKPVSEVTEAEVTPTPVEVVAQEAKTVGDEALPEPREPSASVREEEVAAQVVQPRESDPSTVSVHEVVVVTDEVITDPSSPLAVQVPDAGRGDSSLPIHALVNERVEDVFAREASKS